MFLQALFYSALLCAREMLAPEDGSADLIRALNNRLVALSFHIREYYWIDMKKLNEIYRYKTEEYSYDAVNKFNIYPDQIPSWLVEFMPSRGGYLIGNLQPAHMDFRFFSLGNLWSIAGGLATVDQSHAILDLVEEKWSELVADMPLKICYPALEGQEWRIITGSDPKNTYCLHPYDYTFSYLVINYGNTFLVLPAILNDYSFLLQCLVIPQWRFLAIFALAG